MKIYATLAVALAAITGHSGLEVDDAESSLIHAALHAKWSSYKAKHGKEYAAHEEQSKKNVFLEHTRTIEDHNTRFYQGLESFELAHNEMSDLTIDEIATTRMGVSVPSNANEIMAKTSLHVVTSDKEPPKEMDWRKYNAVTSVKLQGSCGSCYGFSAAGALETAYWRKRNHLRNVSAQVMVDCTEEYGNAGCAGGWMHTAFHWLKDHGGYIAANDYPYTENEDTCKYNSEPKMAQIKDFFRIPAGDEDALLHAVGTEGTVSIALNAASSQFVHYKGGIIDIPDCAKRPSHALLIVGYGSERGIDYWIVKNSWGPEWGEEGYFRIRRGVNMCGLADWASYPVSD